MPAPRVTPCALVSALALPLLASCGIGSAGIAAGVSGGDTPPEFLVSSVSPSAFEQGVDPSTEVRVELTTEVDPDSVGAQSFRLEGPLGDVAAARRVEGSTIVLTPRSRLNLLGEFNVTVEGDLRDSMGRGLGERFGSTFRVADGAPTPKQPFPAAQTVSELVLSGDRVVAFFTEAASGDTERYGTAAFRFGSGWSAYAPVPNVLANSTLSRARFAAHPTGSLGIAYVGAGTICLHFALFTDQWYDAGCIEEEAGGGAAFFESASTLHVVFPLEGNVYGRTFDGTVVGTREEINDTFTFVSLLAGAEDNGSGIVTAWIDTMGRTFYNCFDPVGRWQQEQLIDVLGPTEQFAGVSMGASPSGDVAVVVTLNDDFGPVEVRDTHLDSARGAWTRQSVNQGASCPDVTHTWDLPEVVFGADDSALALWSCTSQSGGITTWLNRYTPTTNWSTSLILAPGGEPLAATVASDRLGNGLAVWADGGDTGTTLMYRRFDPSSGWSEPTSFGTTDDCVTHMELAFDESGRALVVWSEGSTCTNGDFTGTNFVTFE